LYGEYENANKILVGNARMENMRKQTKYWLEMREKQAARVRTGFIYFKKGSICGWL
jgi:hypothetical protein